MSRMTPKALRNGIPRLAAFAAFVAFILLVAAASCASTPTGVAAVAGRYELRAVDGRSLPDDRLGGAIAGELVLTAGGRATRTVTYARSGLPDPSVRRMAGTFRVRGTSITLALSAEGATPTSRRELAGEVAPSSIVVRYPGPRDRIVEELFVRVAP
jgi:hypothetical protein